MNREGGVAYPLNAFRHGPLIRTRVWHWPLDGICDFTTAGVVLVFKGKLNSHYQ